jgi:hypothetical protein
MEQDLIMPVSALQHRVTAGAYQNKLLDNIRGSSTTQAQSLNSARSAIPDEIQHARSSINRVVNSHEELSRPSYQTTSPRQGIAAPLLMLLSQVRLDGIPISPTTDIPAFTSERSMFPSVSRNAPHSDNRGNGFSTMLSPVANALYETGQFIARNDPLKFPVADASPVPLAETESTTVASVVRVLKSDSYIITGEQKKNELISSLVQYLVSDGQMTAEEGKDVELWLRSEAAGMPMVAARLNNEEMDTSRKKRALAAENDPRTAEHIKEHCAFEEEVLDAQGENQGKVLIFQAQRAENPFRMIYDNNPDGRPSPEERGVADGLNISADILTLGIKPLIGNLVANAKRREYYQNQGDEICAERFRRLVIAEVATSLDVDGLTFSGRGSAGKVKPSELLHALPEQERAAFYTRNPHSGIRREILLELRQGNGAINDNGLQVYLKPTEKKNEFITYHPDAVKPESRERRIIVDENNLSWRYADSFDSSGLNVEISEGKRQIRLHGENYELQQNAAGKYEIVVNKASGIKEYIPVYMEPLSQTWHLNTHNEHPAFSNKQADIIKDIKVNKEDGFYYIPKLTNNRSYYGNGNIYVQEQMGDSGHYPWGRYVEMNGELVPVKEIVTPGHGVHYEVYALKFPEKAGHPIEWDGNRWLFERKTSVHVSKDLKKLISPEMVAEKVDSGKLSAPDHQGLRYDADGNSHIKVKGEYIKLEQRKGLPFIRMNNGDKIYVRYAENKLKPAKINRYKGLVSSNSNEVLKDSRINSLSGLDVLETRHLNEAWSLKGVNIKNKNFNKDNAIGSTIDVTFTMEYNKLKNKGYIEMPPLQWKEKIDLKEGDSKWHFQTDMYEHNPKSMTFFPWVNRYLEAYNFAKSKDKGLFNGNVRIYKKNMEPVGMNDIKSAGTPIEKVKNIQDFLSRNGGVIEITITDVPQILKREIAENKERKLTFDIGFKDKIEVHFNQGIRLVNDGETNVFVTTSDNIKLARGEVNVQPPEIVTKPREHHFSPGEVY